MGRRINISQPTVINTELVPLTDSFALEPNGQTEQWYYENDGTYAPDRRIVPLVITPKLSAFDKDTNQTYTPNISTIAWYDSQWINGKWVEAEITNISDASQGYYIRQDKALQVSKNLSDATHGVTIKCVATFIDPRDAGITYMEEDTIQLTANKDATVFYPDVDILNETTVTFNPLVDENSHKVFKGKVNWTSTSYTSSGIAFYPADIDGTEQVLPDNVDDVTTLSPVMDIMYGRGGEELCDQRFMFRQTAGGEVSVIPDGVATIRRIQGQSVVWNQIVNEDTSAGFNNEGITGTFSNGVWSYSGTPTRPGVALLPRGSWGKGVANHKYYANMIGEHNGNGRLVWISYYTGGNERTEGKKGIFTLTHDSNDIEPVATLLSTSGEFTASLAYTFIDLTLMFGAGNEPETVEEFEAWLAANVGLKDYYDYSESRLLNVNCTGIKTVGTNLFDGTWEEGWLDSTGQEESGQSNQRRTPYFSMPPSDSAQSYKILGIGGGRLFFYDKNKQYISSAAIQAEIISTVPNGARYVRMRATTSNITQEALFTTNIYLSSYVPYKEYTSPMEVVTMKGKLNGQGISTVVFPYGMNSIGDIYDEIYVEDNTLKAVKRLGVVDMGTLNWYQQTDSASGNIRFVANISSKKEGRYNMLCMKFVCDPAPLNYNTRYVDKTISGYNDKNIYVLDSAYTDAATFKTGMSGVMLVYELATPQEYVLDPTVDARYFEWYGVRNGAEVKIDTLPCYVSGQGTDTLTIDAMFGENIPVVLRAKRYPWSDSLYPSKAYRNMTWRIPNIDAIVASDRGQAVHSDNDGGYEFDTIINIKKAILDEGTKNKHLRFKWWMRNTRNNQAVETSVGWGSQVGIGVEDLRNVRGANNSLASTPVYNEVMLLGAYEEVSYTSGNATEYVTYNGVQLFGRTLE